MTAEIDLKIEILGKEYKLAKSLDIEGGYLYDEFCDACEDLLNDIDDAIDARGKLKDELRGAEN